MVEFSVVRRTTKTAPDAWACLTDWARHGDFIPFTTVTLRPGTPVGLGAVFVARTSLGWLEYDDPMEVTHWRSPDHAQGGICRIVKRGRVVTGWAVLTVDPEPVGCRIGWRENANIRYGGPLLDLPTRVAGRRVFSRLVDGLLGDDTSS